MQLRLLALASALGLAACELPPAAESVSLLGASAPGPFAVEPLEAGTRVYTDRLYRVTSVPPALEGAAIIRTPNDAKLDRTQAALRFSLAHEAEVLVAYDERGTVLPEWLRAWEPVEGLLETTDLNRRLYKRRFEAGAIVTLGGNIQGPARGAESNYSVLVLPR